MGRDIHGTDAVIKMKLIIVRHGKDDGRYRGGWSDLDLLPEGVRQAEKLAEYLKDSGSRYRIARIISSDLPRAMSTARPISQALGIDVREEPRVREANNGDLAGMENSIALERYPGLFFSSMSMDEAYPNGESPREFCSRIRDWFLEFSSEGRREEGNTLLVTHGGVINIIYHLARGIEWSNNRPAFPAANCGVHVLNMDSMEFEEENRTDFLIT